MGLASQFPDQSKFIIIVAMIISGVARSYTSIPLFIVNQYIDSTSEYGRLLMGIWTSLGRLGRLGDVAGVMLCQYFLQTLKLSWSVCVYICIGLFLIPTLITVYVADQVYTSSQNQEEKEDSLIQLKDFLKNIQNILYITYTTLTSSLIFTIELWFPYYFLKIGFGFYASLISIVYPIILVISIPFLHLLLRPCSSHYSLFSKIMISLGFLTFAMYLFLNDDPEQIYLYMILTGLGGFFQVGATYQLLTTELKVRMGNNNRLMLIIIPFLLMTIQFGVGLFTLVIGLLVEIDLKNFMYIIVLIMLLSMISQLAREVKTKKDQHLSIEENQIY